MLNLGGMQKRRRRRRRKGENEGEGWLNGRCGSQVFVWR